MFEVPSKFRIRNGMMGTTDESGNNGMFQIPKGIDGKYFAVIASDGEGWEHVSVSLPSRTPIWEEMCMIKNLFWGEGDVVVQFHPAKKDYINNHSNCLHLWRSDRVIIETPPSILVGVK